MSSVERLIGFSPGSVEVYLIDEIYDPAVHETTEGYQIPAVGSIVVQQLGSTAKLYWVSAVDTDIESATYGQSTLGPINISPDEYDRVISYSNDLLCVYYDVSESPTRLIVDAKVFLYGETEVQSTQYALYRSRDGEELVISTTDDLASNFIDLEYDETTNVATMPDCVTGAELVDGDLIYLRTYDVDAVQQTEIRMFARSASALDSGTLGACPITGFSCALNQEDSEGNAILYRGQSTSALVITPSLEFGDGTLQVVAVDDSTCFAYGLDDVDTDLVGMEYTILVKYFLPDTLQSAIAGSSGSSRFVYQEIPLVITARDVDLVTKISTMPYWDGDSWELKFVSYTYARTAGTIGTEGDDVAYDGTAYDSAGADVQEFTITHTQRDSYDVDVTHDETVTFTKNGETDGPPWTILHEGQETPYGAIDDPYVGAYVAHDDTGHTITIDSDVFGNVDVFLTNFYYQAEPPKLASEALAPVPTHFVLRDVEDGTLMTADPVAIEDFAVDLVIDLETDTDLNLQTQRVLRMDFLQIVESTTNVLYGVPVTINEPT